MSNEKTQLEQTYSTEINMTNIVTTFMVIMLLFNGLNVFDRGYDTLSLVFNCGIFLAIAFFLYKVNRKLSNLIKDRARDEREIPFLSGLATKFMINAFLSIVWLMEINNNGIIVRLKDLV